MVQEWNPYLFFEGKKKIQEKKANLRAVLK